MGKISYDDVSERLKGLQVEYQELRKAEEKLRELLAPLTEIDKAERKLAQLYAKLEENWNDNSKRDNAS
jgi:predicted transcriptional regulator